MYLKQLIINNYKNLEQVKTEFTRGINCFVGYNGAGKTNLLSAIYYLSACKDYFNLPDSQNILKDNDFFIIDGHFTRQEAESERVYCGVQRDRGKTMSLNGKDYQRLSDHIGYIPLVMITPSDTMVIHTGSEDRRRMLNFMISQFDRSYLNMVIQYNKVIENRNKSLKIMRESRQIDELTLEMYDVQLVKYGTAIHKTRKTFMEDFIEIFQRYYTLISENNEKVGLQYNSQLNNGEFESLLKQARTADLSSGYTTVGIHKDDLEFTIDHRAVKKSASQGQQKTFIIAIKLAYYDYSASKTEIKPLLLLDDIFDKLDSKRVAKIVELVSADHFGQIFITDANKVRMESILKEINSDYKIFSVTCGQVQLQDETAIIK